MGRKLVTAIRDMKKKKYIVHWGKGLFMWIKAVVLNHWAILWTSSQLQIP